MLLLVACLIGLGVLGVMAPDERLGQADRATHASHEAPAGLRQAGDRDWET